MSKYIDADKLKAEIERRKDEWQALLDKNNAVNPTAVKEVICEDLNILDIINSLQREQPEEICSKCIHHGKDDDYCYYPHGGMQSLINENGVYECTGFCEQEQPEAGQGEEAEVGYWNQIGLSVRLDKSLERLGFKAGDKVRVQITKK